MKWHTKLPRPYAPVNIKFWSLRDSIAPNMGVVFDNDMQVERKCRRVICADGWKWQIVDFMRLAEFDCAVRKDKEILDFIGSDLEFEYV